VDYLALVDSATLLPIARLDKSGGFLVAAIRIGRTRLIDNLFVKPRTRAGRGNERPAAMPPFTAVISRRDWGSG